MFFTFCKVILQKQLVLLIPKTFFQIESTKINKQTIENIWLNVDEWEEEELQVIARRNLSSKNLQTLTERTVKISLSNRSLLQNFRVNRRLPVTICNNCYKF